MCFKLLLFHTCLILLSPGSAPASPSHHQHTRTATVFSLLLIACRSLFSFHQSSSHSSFSSRSIRTGQEKMDHWGFSLLLLHTLQKGPRSKSGSGYRHSFAPPFLYCFFSHFLSPQCYAS